MPFPMLPGMLETRLIRTTIRLTEYGAPQGGPPTRPSPAQARSLYYRGGSERENTFTVRHARPRRQRRCRLKFSNVVHWKYVQYVQQYAYSEIRPLFGMLDQDDNGAMGTKSQKLYIENTFTTYNNTYKHVKLRRQRRYGHKFWNFRCYGHNFSNFTRWKYV